MLRVSKKKRENKEVYKLAVVSIIFFLVIALRYVLLMNISVSIILAIAVFGFLYLNKYQSIAFVMSLFLFGSTFQYKYAYLLFMVIFFLKYAKEMRGNAYILIFIVALLWELLHISFTLESIYLYFNFSAEIFLLMFIMCIKRSCINFELIVRTMSIFAITSFSFVLFNAFNFYSNDFALMLSNGYRLGTDLINVEGFSLTFDPNSIGTMCNCLIAGMSILFLNSRLRKIDYIIIFILVSFGFLTLSRSFILVLILLILGVFYFICKNKRSHIYRNKIKLLKGKQKSCKHIIYNLLIVIGLCALLGILINSGIIINLINRFAVEDLSNGRSAIFEMYNDFIFSEPLYFLFGIGEQNRTFAMEKLNTSSVSHNAIQEALLMWGILGIIIIVFMFISILWSSKNQIKFGGKEILLPIIVLFISIQAVQFLTNGIMKILFIFCYCAMVNITKSRKIITSKRQIKKEEDSEYD